AQATDLECGAVDLDDGVSRRAGALMQTVDVLRDEPAEPAAAFERGEDAMRRVRLSVAQRGIQLVSHLPVEPPRLSARAEAVEGELGRVVAAPDAARAPKIRDPGFRADPRARQHHEIARSSQERGGEIEIGWRDGFDVRLRRPSTPGATRSIGGMP